MVGCRVEEARTIISLRMYPALEIFLNVIVVFTSLITEKGPKQKIKMKLKAFRIIFDEQLWFRDFLSKLRNKKLSFILALFVTGESSGQFSTIIMIAI